MKKIFALAAAFGMCFSASAQLATEMEMNTFDSNSDYNIIGLSYDHTSLSGKNYEFNDNESMGLNGFGIEYIHGFSLSRQLPMFLELGAKINMGFGSAEDPEDSDYYTSVQMLRVNVPVSFAWRFNIGGDMAITPFAGLDFRVNAMARAKYNEPGEEYEWVSMFDDEEMGGDDETWNRFQMGWHLGARFEYNRLSLAISGGTDFIKAFNYSEDGYKSHVNTGNLAITLGYRF